MRKFLSLPVLLILLGCDDETPQPEQHWRISAEYIASTMTLGDAVIRDAIANGQFIPKGAGDLPQGVYARYRLMAARMRLRPTPAIYLDTGDARPVPQAAARASREGSFYILINSGALSQWSPDQLAAVLGHELAHLKERHITPQRLAEAYNQPGLSAAHELEADRIGSGPLGSCDPAALEAALQIVIDAGRRNMLGGVAEVVAGGAGDLPSGDHPSWPQRKAALDAMIANPPPECVRQ